MHSRRLRLRQPRPYRCDHRRNHQREPGAKSPAGVNWFTRGGVTGALLTSVPFTRERPMSELAVGPTIPRPSRTRPSTSYPQILSTSVTVVSLFCLLGLAITAALLPLFAPEEMSWVLSH